MDRRLAALAYLVAVAVARSLAGQEALVVAAVVVLVVVLPRLVLVALALLGKDIMAVVG